MHTTRTAREGAVATGFDLDGMLAVIEALTTADFHKSHDDREERAAGVEAADNLREMTYGLKR